MILGCLLSPRFFQFHAILPLKVQEFLSHFKSLHTKVKVKVKSFSLVRLFATPWTVAHHASPSWNFPGMSTGSGLPFPSPEDLPNPGIEPWSPTLQADALTSEPPGKPYIYAA